MLAGADVGHIDGLLGLVADVVNLISIRSNFVLNFAKIYKIDVILMVLSKQT